MSRQSVARSRLAIVALSALSHGIMGNQGPLTGSTLFSIGRTSLDLSETLPDERFGVSADARNTHLPCTDEVNRFANGGELAKTAE
jgi:hypothetical protein